MVAKFREFSFVLSAVNIGKSTYRQEIFSFGVINITKAAAQAKNNYPLFLEIVKEGLFGGIIIIIVGVILMINQDRSFTGV